MDKTRFRQIIFIILSVICMTAIFLFSSDNAEESSEKSGFFVEVLSQLPISVSDNLSHIVRKSAHFTIYMILGIFVSGIFNPQKPSYTLLICFVYACTDEIHQYFVAGRACRFTDVLIDTTGSVCGILIFMIINYILYIKTIKNK